MSLRDDLAGVLARDPRYSVHAYAFLFEALEHTKQLKRRRLQGSKARSGKSAAGAAGSTAPTAAERARRLQERVQHVSGRELCEGARDLALKHYGFLALTVLGQWGLHATADFGNLVYNLVATGDMLTTPEDTRADFDDVYDFRTALRDEYALALDDAG